LAFFHVKKKARSMNAPSPACYGLMPMSLESEIPFQLCIHSVILSLCSCNEKSLTCAFLCNSEFFSDNRASCPFPYIPEPKFFSGLTGIIPDPLASLPHPFLEQPSFLLVGCIFPQRSFFVTYLTGQQSCPFW
jgi:hypothetical protein